MEVFTYRARSLQEALMLVRHELGPEASVIQTREVGGKFFGLLGKRHIEVQASRDAKVVRRLVDSGTPTAVIDQAFHETEYAASYDEADEYGNSRYAGSPQNETMRRTERFDMSEEDSAEAALLQDSSPEEPIERWPGHTASPGHASAWKVQAASSAGQSASPGRVSSASAGPINYLSPAMFEVFTEMLDADVDPDAARGMLQEVALHCSPAQLDDPWLIKGRLCQIVQQHISVSGPINVQTGQQQIVALVGPTGVGKTTTLAKLAAGFHFEHGTRVGLITLDTFRLGAVDQLQKYADLMGTACEVVSAPDQMRSAIARLSHCHLILIDTAGRSPRDTDQLQVLNQFLQLAQPTEVHLVLSAASSLRSAELAIEQFSMLNPTHLLLTKLDEALCLGNWYRTLATGNWPLSYLTTGQQVPEDIVVANRRRVASLIMGQRA